jgi:hypothetical protein
VGEAHGQPVRGLERPVRGRHRDRLGPSRTQLTSGSLTTGGGADPVSPPGPVP